VSLAIVHGVSKSFSTTSETFYALDHVSLQVEEGTVTALMGVSGSGKSTLLSAMAGLLAFDSGSITIDGTELAGRTYDELAEVRRNRIAFVLQEYNLLPSLSVLDNAALPGLIRGESRVAAEAAAREALELMGVVDKADDYPSSISGGQRQRVAIARALAGTQGRGLLILADEPTGALDSRTGDGVMGAFRTAAEAGAGVVIATHDPRIEAAADHVVRLLDGRLVEAAIAGKEA
jgi:putative ABC transport system ATP-binding protein